MNNNILKATRTRNYLFFFSDYRKTKDESLLIEYKKLRNERNRNIEEAKKTYYNDKILGKRNNLRKLWKSLSRVGYSAWILEERLRQIRLG